MKKTQFASAIITLVFAGSVSAAMPATSTKAAPAPSRAELVKAVNMQHGTVTRAQVIAEMKRARAAGEMRITEGDFRQRPAVASTLTRKEVMNEYKRAKANGEIAVTQADYNVANTKSYHKGYSMH